MASQMASICNHCAAGCTKDSPKILQVKRGQKQRNAPGKARKRRNRVRSGCWRGVQQMRTGGKPEIRTKMHQIAMQHVQKENRQKPRVSAGFVAGAEGLGLGCRLGRAWTQPTGLQAPTTRTAQGAAVPRCQILPHTNEKVRYRRSDT